MNTFFARINNVILTGQGITNINKSDVAGKINLNIPVKISTGRAISTVKPAYRTSYALVRYIAARPFAKTVSSSIDTQNDENIFKNTVLEITVPTDTSVCFKLIGELMITETIPDRRRCKRQ